MQRPLSKIHHVYRHSTMFARVSKLILLVAPLLLCGASAPMPARIALVIGNTHYDSLTPLPNAISDAHKIASQLRKMGFSIQSNSVDLDQVHLTAAVTAFGDRLRSYGPNAVGFFYYAGHAAQDEFGINYLLPTNARAQTPADIRKEGTPLPPLLLALADANTPVNIIVLDACRNWSKSRTNSNDSKGLHDMGQHASMFIAYATRAGQTADEGAGLSSSPFSSRLIEALEQRANEPLVLLFDDVKTLVYSDTDAMQQPLLVDGLTTSGRWNFGSGTLASVPEKPVPIGTTNAISPFLSSLDRAKLVVFFRGKESLADAVLKRRDVLAKYEISTPIRLAYFLGMIGQESGGFTTHDEKFGYSIAGLREKRPDKVTSNEIAKDMLGKPERIANTIYADRLGNGPAESGDGWRYRGRGVFGFFIQGRSNYKRIGEMIGIDLLKAPDLADDPEVDIAISAALWSAYNINPAADAENVAEVKHRLRTPTSPAKLESSRTWIRQAKKIVE